jgi:hypothetical protein
MGIIAMLYYQLEVARLATPYVAPGSTDYFVY